MTDYGYSDLKLIESNSEGKAVIQTYQAYESIDRDEEETPVFLTYVSATGMVSSLFLASKSYNQKDAQQAHQEIHQRMKNHTLIAI